MLGLSLQSGGVSNTADPGLPALLSIPPEEALLHFLLWLSLVVAVPVALVIVANLLTGQRPARLLRTALSERLTACAPLLRRRVRGGTGADGAGAQGLRPSWQAAGICPVPPPTRRKRRPDYSTLVRETEATGARFAGLARVAGVAERQRALSPYAAGLRAAEHSVQDGAPPAAPAPAAPAAMNAAERPLAPRWRVPRRRSFAHCPPGPQPRSPSSLQRTA